MTEYQGTHGGAPRRHDSVDAWLGGTWMDDPEYHDGWSDIRPRFEVAQPQMEERTAPMQAPRRRRAPRIEASYAEATF